MAVYIVIGRVAKNHNRKQTVIGLLFSLYEKLYTKPWFKKALYTNSLFAVVLYAGICFGITV